MRPLEPTIDARCTLREAADQIAQSADAFVVVTSHQVVLGILTAEDVLTFAHRDPTGWQRNSCATVLTCDDITLRPEHPVEGVVHEYRERGIRPLLVNIDENPAALLHPSEVRTWCRKHCHLPLEELMSQHTTHDADAAGVSA